MKYFLYARKSSESEDKQVQSIEDQVDKLESIANRLNLSVIKKFTESKSAKQPNNRPLFNTMIEKISNGEADGILCWKINRLSRNPVDSATIQWMLQQGTIKSIQTAEREYKSDDNQLLLSVESGMANQFILDLRKATLRGLEGKVRRGGYVSLAPLGYLNDKLNKTIIKDPERFELIRKAWNLMLTGNYNPSLILDIMNNEWGFRTRKAKRSGGKKLSLSGIYRMFKNPFYAGKIFYNDKEYQGKHEKMITWTEFQKVQDMFANKNKKRPQKHQFAFTGMIRCGTCGCMVTAEKKNKLIKSTGETKEYNYYRCTRKKKDLKCEEPSITKKELEKQIVKEIEKYTIPEEFKNFALEYLRNKNDEEVEIKNKKYTMLSKSYESKKKELDSLMDMRLKELISDKEFLNKKTEIQKEINELKIKLDENHDNSQDWFKLVEKSFDFVVNAKESFISGDLQKKKEILMTLGKNFILKDKKLQIEPMDWLIPISNQQKNIRKAFTGLEPQEFFINKGKNRVLNPALTRWGA